MELAENISSIIGALNNSIGDTLDDILTHLNLSELPEQPATIDLSVDLEKEIIAMILDLEEKMDVRAIGHIECTTDRDTWRNSLETTGDTVS